MTILRKKSKKEPWEIVDTDNTLEALQEEVGGYIEVLRFFEDLVLIVNEEGRINDMDYTREFCGVQLFGPVLMVATDGEEFRSLKDCEISFLDKYASVRVGDA